MLKRDVAVIEAAETLVQKWREFDNNGQGVDPEDYAEALMRAVSARKEDLKPTTTETPTPSITVGTQVRLTGVVTERLNEEVVWVTANGFSCPIPKDALEVIRQPFKRGEVVHLRGSTVLEPAMVLEDESDGRIIYISLLNVEGQYPHKALASDFERRP